MMSDHQWHLVDDLISEFGIHKNSSGDDWFCIGKDTQAAIKAMWDEVETLTDTLRRVIDGNWSITELQELIGELR